MSGALQFTNAQLAKLTTPASNDEPDDYRPVVDSEWGGAEEMTPTAQQLASLQRNAKRASLTMEFENVWKYLDGPELTKEFRFHPERRWRADYCHEPTRVIVELEGGVWTGGRHTRGQGFINDGEKYNAATSMGYMVFRLATGQVTVDNVQIIIDAISTKGQPE